MIKKEDISFINQLNESLEKAYKKLEEAYEKKDIDEFNKIKKFMIKIQKQISKVIR